MKTRHLLNILLLALYTSSCNKEDTPLIKTETVKIFLLSETNRIQNLLCFLRLTQLICI